MPPLIELRKLTVAYGSFVALKGLDAAVEGSAIGLLGPNGAGKSTLLKTLLGHVRPKEGSARVLDVDARTRPLAVRAKIGYVSERDCYIPGLSAVESVAYAGALSGLKRADALSRSHEMLNYVGLAEARYRHVETYSTGMKQRLKLAQALVHDPSLLLLDEPTNGMDPKGREDMLALVRDVAFSKGIPVLLSSHLLPDVETVCSTVLVLRGGEIAAQGEIEALKRGGEGAFHVRVKGDAAAFAASVRALGATVKEIGTDDFRIVTGNGLGPDDLVAAAAETGVELRRLVPDRVSLEDVFLGTLSDGASAGPVGGAHAGL